MRRIVFVLLVLSGLAVGVNFPSARAYATDDDEGRRRDYLAAIEALKAGQTTRFKMLYERLDGYILRGYLEYESLKNRIPSTPPAEIHRFLEENSQAPISDVIRKKWLRYLAGRGDWDTFLEEYKDVEDEPELQCLRLAHLLKTSEQQAPLMDEVEKLWLTGRPLPSACDPVFDAWRQAGHMTPEKVWARIRLAMEARNLDLADHLARYLDPSERIWVKRWQAMHRDPVRELHDIRYPVDTPVARMIVTHGVVRLANRDPEEAMAQWQYLKTKYQFFGEDDNYVLRYIGILAAQEDLPQALQWLSAVSAGANDETLQLWRVRAALRAGQWDTARRFIAGLTEEQQHESQWRYWTARILEETGNKDEARELYKALAQDRGYYGFLAADRVNANYSMQHVSVEASPEEVSAMLARPGIQMAQELYLMGQVTDARRQWNWTTRNMNNRELAVAAVIARQWGWYDRAILTVARSDHLDDLELRFPLLYRDTIESNAAQYGVDPSWVYGVVRQESAFVVDARSQAGALGLMQLMPSTGRLTGRKLNIRIRSNRALLDIENNLRLGMNYLKEVLGRNNGNQVLATASYNAGPNRVNSWMPEQPMDADIWVETIPYNETRDYVKNVMSYTTVYNYRLENNPVRLSTRMPSIAPAAP
ncbi:MAG TPA: transglycosylase SLT domain-containing protein [Candidatus Methylomirabilis sp.]|nr:transglycosylase SLT domain-containing protein [Candidatus Methylomirabilis sp.]